MPTAQFERASAVWLCNKLCIPLACLCVALWFTQAYAQSAQDLLAKHAGLSSRLQSNQFQRPVVLESTETLDQIRGDVFAVVDHPFPAVSAGLNNPDHWCDVISLHINTKYCRAVQAPGGHGTPCQHWQENP